MRKRKDLIIDSIIKMIYISETQINQGASVVQWGYKGADEYLDGSLGHVYLCAYKPALTLSYNFFLFKQAKT